MSTAALAISGGFNDTAQAPAQPTPQEILQRFEREAQQANFTITYDGYNDDPAASAAVYVPFIYNGQNPWAHSVTVSTQRQNGDGQKEARTPAEIKVSEIHETCHAILWNKWAAGHASFYNSASPIVLAPRDWIMANILSERAAFAYTALWAWADGRPEIEEAMKNQPVTVKDFRDALTNSGGNIQNALNEVARKSLSGQMRCALPEDVSTYHNSYIVRAITTLEESIAYKAVKRYGAKPPIFAKLGEKDILEAGQLAGFSAFGIDKPDDFFAKPSDTIACHARAIKSIDINLDIEDPDKLPTLTQALYYNFGITPEAFLVHSKGYSKGSTKPLQKLDQPPSYPIHLYQPNGP